MAKIKKLEHLRHEAARLFADLQRNFPEARDVLFTGGAGGEGVTALCIALARAVVRQRKSKVLIVDANFSSRTHGLTQMIRATNADGLRDLMRHADTEPGARPSPFDQTKELEPGIDLLARGVNTGTEMADLDNAGLIDWLRGAALEAYDLVIWDSASINTSSDTKVLMAAVPNVILVVESDVTRIDHFNSSIAEIKQLRANLMAVLRNKAGQRPFSVGADQQ